MKNLFSSLSRCYTNLNYKPDYSLHTPVMLDEVLKYLVYEAPDYKACLILSSLLRDCLCMILKLDLFRHDFWRRWSLDSYFRK